MINYDNMTIYICIYIYIYIHIYIYVCMTVYIVCHVLLIPIGIECLQVPGDVRGVSLPSCLVKIRCDFPLFFGDAQIKGSDVGNSKDLDCAHGRLSYEYVSV